MQVKEFLPILWLGPLISIAIGLPKVSRNPLHNLRLGDVVVALPEGKSVGLVTYDCLVSLPYNKRFQMVTFIDLCIIQTLPSHCYPDVFRRWIENRACGLVLRIKTITEKPNSTLPSSLIDILRQKYFLHGETFVQATFTI